MLFVLGACSKAEETKSISASNESITNEETVVETEEVMELALEDKIEQLGDGAISDSLDKDEVIIDKDGYTYVITPYIWVNGSAMYEDVKDGFRNGFKFHLTILKDNEVIHEDDHDLYSELDFKEDWFDFKYIFTKENILVKTLEDSQDENIYRQKLFAITFDHDGNIDVNKVKEETYDQDDYLIGDGNDPSQITTFVHGLDGVYYNECNIEGDCEIFNTDNETISTYDKEEIWPPNLIGGYTGITFIDEEDEKMYLQGTGTVHGYDLKSEDFIWDEAGEKEKFDYPENGHFINGNDGFYHLISNDNTESTVKYFTRENGEFILKDSVGVRSELDKENSYLTLDDTHVHVYFFVEYKGERTIQKYSYPRIDLEK